MSINEFNSIGVNSESNHKCLLCVLALENVVIIFHQVCDLQSAMEDKMMKLMMTSTELDDEKRKNEDLQVVATIVF